MIKQFDIPMPKNGIAMDDAAQALASLAENLDAEEQEAYDAQDLRDDEAEDPPLDRWTNYQEGLTDEEKKKIDLSIWPVWSMLTKVRVTLPGYLPAKVWLWLFGMKLHKFTYAVKKSTTILLPHWFNVLASCGLPHHMMPCDVSTHWNSNYDMLHFALKFRPAIDRMTALHVLDLWKYELSPAECGITKELRDVLNVCFHYSFIPCF